MKSKDSTIVDMNTKDWIAVYRRMDGSTRKVAIKDATQEEAERIANELTLVGEYLIDVA